MLRLSFRTKLLASHVGLVIAVVVIALLDLNRTLVADLHRQLDERLLEQARGAAQWVSEGRRHPDKLAGRLALIVKADVTIFGPAGEVLGDSSSQAPASGTDARTPEVVAAMMGQEGLASRTVPSSHEEMRYVAVPAADGIVLRLGEPLSNIQATASAMQRRLIFASGLAVLIAIGLGFLASQLAARPLRAMTAAAKRLALGDYDIDLRSSSPDEFGILSRTLTALADELKRDMARINKLLIMRRDFVANVSHELRTPVAAIQGYAETLLAANADPATQKQFLEIVFRQAQRLGALVQDLLTLSELEARPGDDAARESVDLAALAGHVVETVRARAKEQQTKVTIEVDPGASALGDPIGIEQVIQNLVDNAIKYGKQGGAVRVRGERTASRVVLTVADDGPGIAAEHLPRLFERFYRVDAGRSRERGGTGLGLAIVKHLVESMGGAIEVTSEVGRGTTFRVELPAGEIG